MYKWNNSNINKLERKINKLTTVEENSIIIFSQSLIDQAHKNLGKIQISKLNLMLKKENSASNSKWIYIPAISMKHL